MGKTRVHELAAEFGVPAERILELLREMGVFVRSHLSSLETDQVAQAEIQKWLATNPGKLDGIIIQSASELGALRALKQSGRDMIPFTIGGELGALCYWRKNPDFVSSTIQAWPPGDDFELGWNVMMRTLQGQGPNPVPAHEALRVMTLIEAGLQSAREGREVEIQ